MTLDRHIESTAGVCGGQPRIAGRRITVASIAVAHEMLGQTADEIASAHELSLADVHAALAYYFDHKAEMDEAIVRDREFVAQLQAALPSKVAAHLNRP
jgi:uncharacterized protein (DUF433 family)